MLKTTVRLTALDSHHRVLNERDLTFDAMVAGKVCGPCNGGWMNDLEAEMRRVLPPLVEGSRLAEDLDEHDRLLLARWACKVAYCHDAASHGARRVPASHAEGLCRDKGRLPHGVVVLAARSPHFVPIDQVDSPNWTVSYQLGTSEERLRKDNAGSYKLAWQFGHLVLIVAFWPRQEQTYGLVLGLHQVVWLDRRKVFMVAREEEPDHGTPQRFLADAVWALEVLPVDHPGGEGKQGADRVIRFD